MQLIFHIGAGKTGTSSIQKTLGNNHQELKKQGIHYLGLMLENAFTQKYPWQKASASEVFHSLTKEETYQQASEILFDTLDQANNHNIHTLIWSNESFFGRHIKLQDLLIALQAKGIELKIVTYVRRHDSWIRSAYVQWGISHKTYNGTIKPFQEWSKTHKANFYSSLSILNKVFHNQLIIRNMDTVGDVVSDFLKICNISNNHIKVIRSNESPNNEELLLRAMFNNRFEDKVLPVRFDRILFDKKLKDISSELQTPHQVLKSLLPSKEDIQNIRDESSIDREMLNILLKEQNQEFISENSISHKNTDINIDKLLMLLSEIVISQALRINRLEKIVENSNKI